MKLIHVADLHLDSRLNTNLKEDKARERRHELTGTWLRLVDYAAKHAVTAILIAGDLFDTAAVTETTANAVLASISGHPEIAFFYVKGNHDQDSFLNREECLPENLYLFTDSWKTYRLPGNVAISGRELGTNQSAVASHLPADWVARTLQLSEEDYNIVMLHGQIVDSRSTSGTEEALPEQSEDDNPEAKMETAEEVTTVMPVPAVSRSSSSVMGDGEEIHLPEFAEHHIDYLALGHVHKYMEGTLDGRGIWCYPGCLEGRGFDECGAHGFVLMDLDPETHKLTRERIDIAARHLHEVTVDVSGLENSVAMERAISQKLTGEKTSGEIPAKDFVKVILTGELSMEAEMNLPFLESRIGTMFYVTKLDDRTTRHIPYEKFRDDRSLKGAFIQNVEKDPALTPELRAEIIETGLRLLRGQEV